jgi:hypothetical protein
MLIEWMNERAHPHAIVHPNPGELRAQVRPAIQRAWAVWDVSDRIRLVAKTAE